MVAPLLSMVRTLQVVCCVNDWHIEFRLCACRAEDFWQGYKLFCFAYYSNSEQHVAEFRHSKLGSMNLPKLCSYA